MALALLAVVGCGAHHVTMHDAVLRYVCGDVCTNGRDVRLDQLRRAGEYATAVAHSVPAGWFQDNHVLLHHIHGDWRFVDAWSDLGSLSCGDVAAQMRVPERVLRSLAVCD